MDDIDELIKLYRSQKYEYERFLGVVREYITHEPILNDGPLPIIHSLKWRIKAEDHLRDKLERKKSNGEVITKDNLFDIITDFAGIRILHLHQQQFVAIHEFIMGIVKNGDWKLVEDPVANTWDPESVHFFQNLGLRCNRRDNYYTSIHYLVKPNNERSKVCCEIQVRTLFEEVWGEISHYINYPHETDSLACKEQIRVLSKLVSTGSRLADSIFKCHEQHISL